MCPSLRAGPSVAHLTCHQHAATPAGHPPVQLSLEQPAALQASITFPWPVDSGSAKISVQRRWEVHTLPAGCACACQTRMASVKDCVVLHPPTLPLSLPLPQRPHNHHPAGQAPALALGQRAPGKAGCSCPAGLGQWQGGAAGAVAAPGRHVFTPGKRWAAAVLDRQSQVAGTLAVLRQSLTAHACGRANLLGRPLEALVAGAALSCLACTASYLPSPSLQERVAHSRGATLGSGGSDMFDVKESLQALFVRAFEVRCLVC